LLSFDEVLNIGVKELGKADENSWQKEAQARSTTLGVSNDFPGTV
jgi:hypothetical protein